MLPSRFTVGALIAVVLAVVLVIIAVRDRSRRAAGTSSTAASSEALTAGDVELSSCAAVLAGPVCELPADGAVRAWVARRAGAVTFATEKGAVAAGAIAEVQGGTLHHIVVPAGASELRVLSPSRATVRVLRIAPKSAPAWVERARSQRQKGEIEGASALVAASESSGNTVDRAFAKGLRARLELAAGHTEASFPLFREAVRLHRESGRVSDAADDSFALAFALNQRSYRYAEARTVLAGVHGDVADYPDGRVREAYYRGTLASETGDARSAFLLLREARENAARLGLAVLERNAINAYALQLGLVGRVSEALSMLGELEHRASSADVAACERAEIAINTGFSALLANEQRGDDGALVDAVEPLTRAVSLCEQGCSDRYLRTAALGNLALAALQRGDRAGARARLTSARTGLDEARAAEVLFWYELDGRIALADGDAQRALAAFEEEASRARRTLSYEAEWRARVGKGMALERLARNDDAIAEYLAAEKLLTTLSLLVPLGEGRGTFVGDRGRSARAAVDVLVRVGRADEALAVARSSRARVVAALAHRARLEGFGDDDRVRWESALGAFRSARAALDTEAKDDWKLSRTEATRARAAREGREGELRAALDAAFAVFAGAGSARQALELAPLPGDALTVAYHPVRRGWVGLVAERRQVTSFPIASLPRMDDAAALSETLLVPLRARLAQARVLRVLSFGPLRGVDFHALPYEGKPLVAKVAVEYPLDLPEASITRADAPEPRGRALVISDPTLDLAGTRTETEHVVRAIRDAGSYDVDVLEGPRATSASMLPLLSRAKLLHYAGHGVFAGREGWQSALPLAGGGHLTLGDVLASNTVPKRVVLSGCETARTAADAPAEALGLAQAFVVAGADFVVAPTRPVDDAVAARISTALYGALASSGEVDAAAALRDAQLRVHEDQPALDWSAFRVVCR